MKLGLLKKILPSNLNLKILSLFIGFSLWYWLIQITPVSYTFTIPICFDDDVSYSTCSADAISVTLLNSKYNFYELDKENIAFHVTKNDLSLGKNILPIDATKLLLPLSFKLIDCCPATITITI